MSKSALFPNLGKSKEYLNKFGYEVKRMKLIKSVLISTLATLSIIPLVPKAVMAQAQVSGASVHFIPDPISSNDFIQTISGSVSIPTGSFIGPTTIQPIQADSLPFPTQPPPNDIAPGPSLSNINGTPTFVLLINPGGIDLTTPTAVSLNQQAAAELEANIGNISNIVSILRANSNFLSNPSTEQAVAAGSTTLVSPDGLIQTASVEYSLPIGLLFLGFDDNENTGNCNGVSGCIIIKPYIDDLTFIDPFAPPNIPVIQELTIDPGPVGLVNEPFDLATSAASILNGETRLSNIVSIIRAVSDANGVATPQVQAKVSGAMTIENIDGTTVSLSGEIALPAGLYFATGDPLAGANIGLDCVQAGLLGCVSILPELEYLSVGSIDFINATLLTINPGEVQPGDPSGALNPGALNPASTDLNASAAFKIYENAGDINELSDLVSIVRAGAGGGANGLSPDTRPGARASGSATIVLPNGATMSVNGETSSSSSRYFQGGTPPVGSVIESLGYCDSSACLIITPTITIDITDVNESTIEELTIDPGIPSADAGWDFDAAAGYALSVAGTLSEQVSIIRAGGGLE